MARNVQPSHACNCRPFNCRDVTKKVVMILILILMLKVRISLKIRFRVGVRSISET